ncbi:MAG: HAMP domain-containing protein [Planctomycetaceae bacterium]|nr:HAMP domain-containing protein [Planctomycetaceae bacterium]
MFEELKTASRTIRFRLMLWNAFVVLLTAFAVLIGIRAGVSYNLLHALDEILLEDMEEIRLAIEPELPFPISDTLMNQLDRKAIGHVHHHWFVQILDVRGDEIYSSVKAPDLHPEVQQIRDLRPFSSDGYRLVQLHLTNEKRELVTVRIGASLEFHKADMARIDRLFATVAGIVLIVAPLFGYWLAGRAINPLADIIETTARLRPSQLEERLPIRNTGDELDKLSETVNGLLNRIADHLEQKHDFLANSAHELRTPIAAIRSSVEVALERERSAEDYQELLIEVIEECGSLEILVNQLLLLAETETDRITNEGDAVPFHELVERAVDMFQGVADSHDINLTFEKEGDAYVDGYAHHLRQLINNLLDNAFKFTPAGGHISVTLHSNRESNTCHLTVSDSGRGIPPEDLPHVFERFFRGDRSRAHANETRGTGLGLSICQAVVLEHGGQIDVESRLGTGTTFKVTLPIVKAPVHAASATV